MYRFFVDKSQIDREQELIHILGNDVNHIKNVLRMKPGEQILISAGEDQEYTCQIQQVQQEEILAHIQEVQTVGMELPCKIYLFQGLPKSDKMELIIQKAVELGVYEIIPVETKRCVVKLDAKKEAAKLTVAGNRRERSEAVQTYGDSSNPFCHEVCAGAGICPADGAKGHSL
jgi:16S rRNA (uracil1498-N3)-methyltransferase